MPPHLALDFYFVHFITYIHIGFDDPKVLKKVLKKIDSLKKVLKKVNSLKKVLKKVDSLF